MGTPKSTYVNWPSEKSHCRMFYGQKPVYCTAGLGPWLRAGETTARGISFEFGGKERTAGQGGGMVGSLKVSVGRAVSGHKKTREGRMGSSGEAKACSVLPGR